MNNDSVASTTGEAPWQAIAQPLENSGSYIWAVDPGVLSKFYLRIEACDMAGNVREWCWNAWGGARYILGGAWPDPAYTFTYANVQSPLDRSSTNGIRLVRYSGEMPEALARAEVGEKGRILHPIIQLELQARELLQRLP